MGRGEGGLLTRWLFLVAALGWGLCRVCVSDARSAGVWGGLRAGAESGGLFGLVLSVPTMVCPLLVLVGAAISVRSWDGETGVSPSEAGGDKGFRPSSGVEA